MSYEAIDDNGREVTLRKRRRCEWCGEWSEVGDRAVRRVYKWDGDFVTSKMHPECYAAMLRDAPDDGWNMDMVRGKSLAEMNEMSA